jgi:hypothetical protein
MILQGISAFKAKGSKEDTTALTIIQRSSLISKIAGNPFPVQEIITFMGLAMTEIKGNAFAVDRLSGNYYDRVFAPSD